MKYKFSDLIDIGGVERLLGLFHKATGISAALIDPDGTIIAASGTQELCAKFHRANPLTRQRCIESNTVIADQVQAGERFATYTCRNGLVDAVIRISVEREHLANFFTGQFLFEPPDLAFFGKQARQFGFDERAYMQALASVPVMSKEKLQPFFDYFSEFARMLAEMGLRRLRELQAQEAILRDKALLKALVEGTTDAVYAKDRDGRYLLFNVAAGRMTGKEPHDVVGRDDTFLFPAREAEKVMDGDRAVMEAGSTRTYEEVLTMASGKKETHLATKGPLFDAEGRLAGLFGISRDITERKQTEEALRKTERELRTLLDNIPEGIARFDAECRHLFVNPAVAKTFGIGSEDFVGRTVYERAASENAALSRVLESAIRRVFEEGVPNTMEGEYVTARGVRSFSYLHVPERDERGKVVSVLGIAHDVTERKRAEEELRKSRDELEQRVEERTAELKLEVDERKRSEKLLADARNLAVKLGAASDLRQALHLCLDAALAIGGMDFGCIYLFDPDTNSFRLEVEKNLPRALAGRIAASGRRSPYGYLIADGRAIYRRQVDPGLPPGSKAAMHGMAIFPITSEARIVGSLNVASSTLVPGASVALEMVAAQIGGALERITTEQKRIRLEEQLRQSQKMEAIGTLAGGIAHDFNNILAAILGNAELATDHAAADSSIQQNLNRIRKSSIRARDLVRQMLTFSKTSDQGHKPVRLKPLVDETFQLLRASLPSTIEMTLHVSAQNDTVVGSEGQIQQIIMNLVNNAKQAIADTGLIDISLYDAVPAGSPAPEGIRADDYVVIAVRDTGCGIDESVRARIFEPFFTTRTVGQGTGLGLSVVYGIVTGHGGLITVESALGEGSIFRVFLPKTEADVEPVKEAVDRLPRGHEHILFVDDEEPLCDLIAERLSRLGYRAATASSGEEALQLFREDVKRFDVVITDYTMPTMTGLTLSKELLSIRPDLPIILCTGYSERVSKEVAEQLGIARFLMKPITKKELADTIRTVLDRMQGTRGGGC